MQSKVHACCLRVRMEGPAGKVDYACLKFTRWAEGERGERQASISPQEETPRILSNVLFAYTQKWMHERKGGSELRTALKKGS